ncbi:hypothetical protein TNCV_1113751 [Trichonephila clavipes]|nr:hypothetical protein TNCV_1113751 [Trichonephila clavipes]
MCGNYKLLGDRIYETAKLHTSAYKDKIKHDRCSKLWPRAPKLEHSIKSYYDECFDPSPFVNHTPPPAQLILRALQGESKVDEAFSEISDGIRQKPNPKKVGDIERLFEEARRNTETKHENWKKYYNRRCRHDVQIKVNDWVWVATHPLSSATKKVVAVAEGIGIGLRGFALSRVRILYHPPRPAV